jgi:periplasmic divalent cation tolerance protein
MMKSKAYLLNQIQETVLKNHPYDCPEIIMTPILGGNPSYLKWIDENTLQEND